MTTPGLDRLVSPSDPDPLADEIRFARVGLVTHPASVTRDLRHAADAVLDAGLDLRALFGPQHGARGEKQDNMIESDPFVDRRTGLPVHSLYGDVRRPTPEMLDGLDVLLFDLQDVGVRIYTFMWTMALAMEACAEAGVRFVVLDRPNPIGGRIVEGPVLRPGFESFVGLHPVPMRHGLTCAEMARWLNAERGIGCELDVVPCRDWTRDDWWEDTGRPWVLPSPNIPSPSTCAVYPGMVLVEGTTLSEGRGTTRPFELFGAPYVQPYDLVDVLESRELPGVRFRPCWFEPTFHKHAGQLCGGAQIHVLDQGAARPVRMAVEVFRAVRDVAGGAFDWTPPPYEYEREKAPIDVLWGGSELRLGIDAGHTAEEILAGADVEADDFREASRPYRLYD